MIGKSFLPKSLFGRALLILVLPTVLIQLVMAYVFFDRHWDNVSRHLSQSLASETAFLARQIKHAPPARAQQVIDDFEHFTGIAATYGAGKLQSNISGEEFQEYQEQLRMLMHEPFTVRKADGGGGIETAIRLPGGTLTLTASVKRLESRTTVIFLCWMMGVSVVFLLIAIIFMRNQIRPIRRLARAADSFGRGVDTPNFKPSGAIEVRQAARAFIVMRERIGRQLRTRTDMLAGISHDLRTPLTRMKLQLAMLGDSEAARELSDDVQQMEHMIAEYLDFARGEGREETVSVGMRELLADVVEDYRRLSADVALEEGDDRLMDVRVSGFRRMLHNVIDNGLRYGKRCRVSMRVTNSYCDIVVDDDGQGIPPEKREEVFKPFARLEASRNSKTGGVGLGLTIARDIALAHGGTIALDAAPGGGLRVIIRLPL